MKSSFVRFSLALGLAAMPALLQAQPTAHYVPGIEGIKGASLPPPGWYVRDYNVAYTADRVNNGNGDSAGPSNFDAFTFANVPRVLWITDKKFLGGFIGVDALLPVVYQSVTAGPFDSSTFGIGDFFVESTLSWHVKHLIFRSLRAYGHPPAIPARPRQRAPALVIGRRC